MGTEGTWCHPQIFICIFYLLVSYLEHTGVMCHIVKGWGSNNAFNTARTNVGEKLCCA